jgi:hypothetical protein
MPTTLAVADLLNPELAARVLNWCAERGGGGAYRRAAGHVAGGASGRPSRDDLESLEAMRQMLTTGRVPTVWQAARLVAGSLVGEHSESGTIKRLAIKYRKYAETPAII